MWPFLKTTEFLAWVQAQKSNVVFNFDSLDNCALSQYLRTIVGPGIPIEVYATVYHLGNKVYHLPLDLKEVYLTLNNVTINKFSYGNHPMTFGDLATAIDAGIAKEPTP